MPLSSLLAAVALAAAPGELPRALEGKLVAVRGGRVAPAEPPGDARLFAFYFGAGWCGPCRAFVPELRGAYPRLRAAKVAVVFVSDDVSCTAMRDYMVAARMPWPALDCRARHRLRWLREARGAALPGLLVYDRAGALVATSWSRGRSAPAAALRDLLTTTAP